jgi:hypothetical protein
MAKKESDKKQDKDTMAGMSPKQKAAFKKADKKMDKSKPSRSKDKMMDEALADKIKGKKKK